MCLCNLVSLRTSSVNITQMQFGKYSNTKSTVAADMEFVYVDFCRVFFLHEASLKNDVVYMVLVNVSSYHCDLCGAVNQPTLHHTWLHPPPFPFPPHRQKWCHCAMMEHKSNPRVLAAERGAWFIFMTSLFRCSHLLCVCRRARGTTSGLRPDPQVFIQGPDAVSLPGPLAENQLLRLLHKTIIKSE